METKKRRLGISEACQKSHGVYQNRNRRKYEVSDEAYHTLKRIVKNCEKLIKAYEKKAGTEGKRAGKVPESLTKHK